MPKYFAKGKDIITEINEAKEFENNEFFEDSIKLRKFDEAAKNAYQFVWHSFCDWYLELSKTILFSDNKEAIKEVRNFISKKLGDKYIPTEPRIYKSKAKNAQEAHECIRPTDINLTPKDIKQYITGEEFKLYEIIWQRAVSSQMASAVLDQVGVDIVDEDQKIKIMSLSGVKQYPMRVKCATLAWHTLTSAINGKKEEVNTENIKN